MRCAAPPVAGSVQMLPCRSMASVRPSGEAATDIEVPSLTMTSMGPDGGTARKPPAAATTTPTARTAEHNDRRFMAVSLSEDEAGRSGILCEDTNVHTPKSGLVATHFATKSS